MSRSLDRISIAFTLAQLTTTSATAQGPDLDGNRHVLLISIDGMHALD